MSDKNPLDKYKDTSARASSSVSIGKAYAMPATAPNHAHAPIPKPTFKPYLVVDNTVPPKSQSSSGGVGRIIKRVPIPLIQGIIIGATIANQLLKEEKEHIKLPEKTDEERANELIKEIRRYDPDYTYPHAYSTGGIMFLSHLLHYWQLRYYNQHRYSCKKDFDPRLFDDTKKTLDAKEDFRNSLDNNLPSTAAIDNVQKMEYETYKANGGKLSYNDWLTTVWGKTSGNTSSGKLSDSQMRELAESEAKKYAENINKNWDNIKPSPNARKPSTVDVIVTRDGKVFKGYNTKKGHPNYDSPLEKVDNRIRDAYDSVPKSDRMAETHGRCAEVSALQKAMDAGADTKGAISISADVRNGTIKEACLSCKPALKSLGVSDGACK